MAAQAVKKGGILKRDIRPERILAYGFMALILVGALLLSLPVATISHRSIGFFKALFTSTSAVCVTGLIVVDTGTVFSGFGRVVLLVLIQMGGLGFMVFATLVMVALGRRITLKDRVLLRESMNVSTLSGLIRLTMWYGILTLIIELAGAAVLSIRMIPLYGVGQGIFYSVFHSVSAFCNAGFDLFGHFQSLTAFQHDPVVLLCISVLIILGGLGFSVIMECGRHRRDPKNLSLHAKLVLIISGGLLVFGTLFFLAVEWANPDTLGAPDMTFGDKLLNAWFQSVTFRTAGFNSVDLGATRDASKLMAILLMFVGASPASTGGGVKTTTIGVLLLLVLSVVRGDSSVTVLKKRVPEGQMRRGLAILFISLVIMLSCTILLTVFEKETKSAIDLMYEAASAMGTVGVSAVGTPGLTTASQIMLIPVMFFGRVGPLTLALALANRSNNFKNRVKYPEEPIIIG